jgi:hypothetical protein
METRETEPLGQNPITSDNSCFAPVLCGDVERRFKTHSQSSLIVHSSLLRLERQKIAKMGDARAFDVLVWGATGYTGRLVCEALATQYQARRGKLGCEQFSNINKS